MNSWFAVLLASFAVYSWKIMGYLVPKKLLASNNLSKLAGYLTIALLAGLVGVQTFVTTGKSGKSQTLVIDERLPAILVAVVLLKLKAPFIVIVVVAAGVAAGLRLAF